MAIVINCTGLQSPGGNEERDIAYLTVEYNEEVYAWSIYVPLGVNLGQYIIDNTARIQAEIDAKEAEWDALDPKTISYTDPFGEVIEVNLMKSDFVKPEVPDYYAKRRAEYPPLSDQIGALLDPNSTPSLADIVEKISAVKAKYPKPQ